MINFTRPPTTPKLNRKLVTKWNESLKIVVNCYKTDSDKFRDNKLKQLKCSTYIYDMVCAVCTQLACDSQLASVCVFHLSRKIWREKKKKTDRKRKHLCIFGICSLFLFCFFFGKWCRADCRPTNTIWEKVTSHVLQIRKMFPIEISCIWGLWSHEP